MRRAALSSRACSLKTPPPLFQDAHSITISLPDHPGYSWFAVYDGHGGKLAAKFGAERMLKYVTESAAWKADSATPESVKAAFHSGFLQADADLRKVRVEGVGALGGGRSISTQAQAPPLRVFTFSHTPPHACLLSTRTLSAARTTVAALPSHVL